MIPRVNNRSTVKVQECNEMPRQTMTLEQVERSIHRIRSLFPSGSRIVEFGISPLTSRLSEHYELTIIERGKVARRWDVDPNLVISTPIKEYENGRWFWFDSYYYC